MASKTYSVNKLLRLTPDEAKTISEKAAESGVNESVYIRNLIGKKPLDYPEIRKALAMLITEVNRIGNNINQVVHNNNSGLYSEADKRHLMAYMKKLNEAVNEVVEAVGGK